MNFFQRIKDGAGKVTDRAQNAVEIGRLNTQITTIEREMGLYYQKMGEVFYEGYRHKDMSAAEKEMIELAKTCDLLAEERDEIRSKIAELKNERLCGSCGKMVTEDGLFCQYCGHKLQKPKPAAPVKEEVTKAADTREKDFDLERSLGLPDPLELLIPTTSREEAVSSARVEEPLDEEREARRQHDLERERKRQEELDLRIRSWQEVAHSREDAHGPLETKIPVVECQICSVELVKGTKWCPHCGSEQI